MGHQAPVGTPDTLVRVRQDKVVQSGTRVPMDTLDQTRVDRVDQVRMDTVDQVQEGIQMPPSSMGRHWPSYSC